MIEQIWFEMKREDISLPCKEKNSSRQCVFFLKIAKNAVFLEKKEKEDIVDKKNEDASF